MPSLSQLVSTIFGQLVPNILSSHIHEASSRLLPDPDVVLVSEDGQTLPCHASVLAAASPLLARLLRKPVIQEEEEFLEPFFASPSSPKPFIFRGTPDPYSEADLFGSASTVKPFFPTVKSVASVSKSPFSIQPSITPPQSDILPPSFKGTFSFITLPFDGHNQIIY